MSVISEYIASTGSDGVSLGLLPLVHSCECFSARSILSQDILEARKCKVLSEKLGSDLLYFYYGKPSYPVGEKEKYNRNDVEYTPVCFIANPKCISIDKVYPFDSGAFGTTEGSNRYGQFFHRGMEIDHFELEPSFNGIRSYINAFFGNNDNYIDGCGTKCASAYCVRNNPCVNALISLMSFLGASDLDERARTIEVITKSSVNISTSIRCVIMPKTMLQDQSIKEFLDNNSIDYITYNVRQLMHPSKYYGLVFEMAMTYINTQSWGD